jgi:ADP-ribosylglycohydrolase/protein-tyrosine phosphatase
MWIDLDRAAGALLGLAAGDALGAGYEFTTPAPGSAIGMVGGGACGWEPGEWTDDTAQAVAIADVTATGTIDLDAIGRGFLAWFAAGPKDVGISTGAVLRAAGGDPTRLREAAAGYVAAHPRGGAGNGSLMRTAPVALACLGDDEAIRRWATEVSLLTHGDPLAAEACVLWCTAIDRAVREARLDGVRDGLALLPADRRAFWAEKLEEAESAPPSTFRPNGFVVTALQAAHAAIVQTPIPQDEPARHLQDALVAAVRIGHDTDTVAAIAGQVLGARWGSTAVPWRWRRLLHGWHGYTADDLVRLAVLTASGGRPDSTGWPSAATLVPDARRTEGMPICAPLPDDPDLLVGNLPGLPAAVEAGVDAIVSLCRVGTQEVPASVEHHRFRLVDDTTSNAHPAFVLRDAVEAVRTLREEGKRVYLHCHGGRSRTAAVASGYLVGRGVPLAETLARLTDALPEAHHRVFGPLLASMPLPGERSRRSPA